MSISKNVKLWKEKAEVDYISLFVPLWLAVNAWMHSQWQKEKDRELLDALQGGDNPLADRFADLFHDAGADGVLFKGNLAEFHRALSNAAIRYDVKGVAGTIGFQNAILNWNNGNQKVGTVLKNRNQRDKIQLDSKTWFDDHSDRVFAAYIEITYQIRCSLFHGTLIPNKANERVIKQAYLTLSMLMEHIQ